MHHKPWESRFPVINDIAWDFRFAAPTHRLQAQIQATARVLDLEVSTFYLPNVMLISFGDAGTSTSNLKFIRQGSSLDLSKLLDAHKLYWKVRK